MLRTILYASIAVLLCCNLCGAREPTPASDDRSPESNEPALRVRGEGVTPAQRGQFEKYFLSGYSANLQSLEGPPLAGVITGNLYLANIVENDLEDAGTFRWIVSYDGKSFKAMPDAFPLGFTNQELPALLKLIDKDFKLAKEADAKKFLAALDKLYETDDPPQERIRHTGNRWVFVREKFLNRFGGFVVTTDDDGTITNVRYSLEIE